MKSQERLNETASKPVHKVNKKILGSVGILALAAGVFFEAESFRGNTSTPTPVAIENAISKIPVGKGTQFERIPYDDNGYYELEVVYKKNIYNNGSDGIKYEAIRLFEGNGPTLEDQVNTIEFYIGWYSKPIKILAEELTLKVKDNHLESVSYQQEDFNINKYHLGRVADNGKEFTMLTFNKNTPQSEIDKIGADDFENKNSQIAKQRVGYFNNQILKVAYQAAKDFDSNKLFPYNEPLVWLRVLNGQPDPLNH